VTTLGKSEMGASFWFWIGVGLVGACAVGGVLGGILIRNNWGYWNDPALASSTENESKETGQAKEETSDSQKRQYETASQVHNDNSVTSQGQTGGITAQTVIENQTINNYFANQPLDEKEKWRRDLTNQYPLGWWLLAADGEETYTSHDLKCEAELTVDWQTARVARLSQESVFLNLPSIVTKDRHIIIMSGPNIQFGVSRRVGHIGDGFKLKMGQATLGVDVLKDGGSFVVLAIGLRKPQGSDRVASPSDSNGGGEGPGG